MRIDHPNQPLSSKANAEGQQLPPATPCTSPEMATTQMVALSALTHFESIAIESIDQENPNPSRLRERST